MALEGSTFSAKKFERVIQAWVSPTQSLSCQQLHNIMAHDASDRDGPNEKTPLLLVPGLLCSPCLYAQQVAALSTLPETFFPDCPQTPLPISHTSHNPARWMLN